MKGQALVLHIRKELKEHSLLEKFGALAISRQLQGSGSESSPFCENYRAHP